MHWISLSDSKNRTIIIYLGCWAINVLLAFARQWGTAAQHNVAQGSNAWRTKFTITIFAVEYKSLDVPSTTVKLTWNVSLNWAHIPEILPERNRRNKDECWDSFYLCCLNCCNLSLRRCFLLFSFPPLFEWKYFFPLSFFFFTSLQNILLWTCAFLRQQASKRNELVAKWMKIILVLWYTPLSHEGGGGPMAPALHSNDG